MSIVQRRKARSTGALIAVLDNRQAEWVAHPDPTDYDYDPEMSPNKWLTMCETHGFIIHHSTRALAVAWSAQPEGWCEGCCGDPDYDHD